MNITRLITRRQALVAGAIAGTSIVGARFLHSDDTGLSISAPDREVLYHPAGTPEFKGKVEDLYPGIHSDPAFSAISPLAVLIQHKSGPSIRAYTVQWTISTGSDAYSVNVYHYNAPGTKADTRKVKMVASAQKPLLRVGESHLVTPYFAWTPETYQKVKDTNWSKPLKHSEPAGFLSTQLTSGAKVQGALDGVIFSDRKVSGPDTGSLALRLSARRDAEHDEAVSIHRLIRSGASPADIAETLTAHGSVARSTKEGKAGFYATARRHQAQVFLKLHGKVSADKFAQAVDRLRALHKTNIKAVSA